MLIPSYCLSSIQALKQPLVAALSIELWDEHREAMSAKSRCWFPSTICSSWPEEYRKKYPSTNHQHVKPANIKNPWCFRQITTGWWFQPLWKMSSSVGMMKFPIYGNIKFMFQTTNQSISIHLSGRDSSLQKSESERFIPRPACITSARFRGMVTLRGESPLVSWDDEIPNNMEK